MVVLFVSSVNSLHECITSLPEMAIAMSCARLFNHAANEVLRCVHKMLIQGSCALQNYSMEQHCLKETVKHSNL